MRVLLLGENYTQVDIKPALEKAGILADYFKEGSIPNCIFDYQRYDSVVFVVDTKNKKLAEAIKNICSNTDLIYQNISINKQLHKCFFAKKEVSLSRKEFLLLEYFIKNHSRVISRNELIENVWDMNADYFSNTLETHMLTLRKKLKQAGCKEQIIHTITGFGYKLE